MSGLWNRVKPSSWRQDSIKIQYMSDLHLEAFNLYDKFEIPRAAPYLILAGDVGRLSSYDKLLSFFRRQCDSFDHVYYVLGNHEFYGLDPQRCVELANKLEQEKILAGKLTILNRTRIDLDSKVTLLGCTLFSRVHEDKKQIVQEKVRDFNGQIYNWSVDDHNREHEKETLWLQQQIEELKREQQNRKIVVVTHYAPSTNGTAEERYKNNPWSSAFATDLIDNQVTSWSGRELISHWIFGHTHHCCELLQSDIKIVSNQHGYFPQNSKSNDSDKTTRKLFVKSKAKSPQEFDVKKCIEIIL